MNIIYTLLLTLTFLTFIQVSFSETAKSDIKNQFKQSNDFKKSLIDSLAGADGCQYITLGPMKNGNMINIDIHYHNGIGKYGSGIPSIKISAKKDYCTTNKNDHYNIDFPRIKIIKSIMIADASMACFKYKNLCQKQIDYLEKVDKISLPKKISDIILIDDINPSYKDDLEKFRNTKIWKYSILEGYKNIILTIALHEIAHVALGHISNNNYINDKIIIEQEAEADGFAMALFNIADMNISSGGGMIALYSELPREEIFGEFKFQHPKSVCRIQLFSEYALLGINKNKDVIKEKGYGEDTDQISTEIYSVLNYLNDLVKNNSKITANDCSSYIKNVEVGIKKSLSIIDKNTIIKSIPDVQ